MVLNIAMKSEARLIFPSYKHLVYILSKHLNNHFFILDVQKLTYNRSQYQSYFYFFWNAVCPFWLQIWFFFHFRENFLNYISKYLFCTIC